MHFNTLSTVATVVAVMAQTGEANIGQGASLLGKIFGEVATTAWDVGVEVATKKVRRGEHFISKRVPQGENPYPGVSDEEYNRCYNDLAGTSVTVTSPGSDAIQFDNIPASCMNLANVLAGDGSGGPYATPCGSACLQYTGLSQSEFNQIAEVLQDAPQ